MSADEILEYIEENNPDAKMFVDPDFKMAIVGWVENSDGMPVLCYDYNMMVECLRMEYEEYGAEDPYVAATEWIDYNTLRTIPYMGEGRPVILYN